MLNVERRGRIYRLKGVVGGKLLRLSLGTRDKEAANSLRVRIERARAEGPDSPSSADLRGVLPPSTFKALASLFGWREYGATWKILRGLFEKDMQKRQQVGRLSGETVTRYTAVLNEFEAFTQERGASELRDVLETLAGGAIDYKVWRRARILEKKTARGASSIDLDIAVLHQVFNFAMSSKLIPRDNNPVGKIQKPGKSPTAGARPYDRSELVKLREHAGDDFLIFLLLRHTGFRRTDAVKLTWEEVKFQERVIKRCTQKRKKTVEVPIHPELLAALQFDYECRKPQPADAVLLSPVTRLPMPPRKLTARIVALGKRERAGVKRAHPHRFRDTLAVDLLSKGLGIYDVAKILGDTVAVIEAHYAEFVTVLRERARRAIEDTATGLESTLEGTVAAPIPVSAENKEVMAAGPVSRILSAGLLRRDGHSSGPRIAARL